MTGIWLIDAFAEEAFKGNPAGVCLMEAFPEDSVMQNIAMEMNQAETAFLVKRAPREYALRWFTPAAEIDLCGHATLAATHRLYESGDLREGETVKYHTRSGELQATVFPDGIELDFPALPGKSAPIPDVLKEAVGAPVLACENNGPNYLVEVEDYKTLLACTPHRRIMELGGVGVAVTTNKDIPAGFDFVSRYFAPNYGIDEDPVTGSAHCLLAPFWARKTGKFFMRAFQASRRGGVLDIRLESGRLFMKGRAVTTMKGQLTFPSLCRKERAA